MKTKKVFKQRIAVALRLRGFKIIGVEPNRCKPEFDVYIFEDTKEFQKAFTEIINSPIY